mmetsp:Transcript_21073/g.50112  ORF Transcript_21073/g.50112 Transcript_21073/m.50112 type:complete len:313 (-) Transcript_21073:3-941(-)
MDIDRPLQLVEQPLHVLLGALAFRFAAREERVLPHVLHNGARGALDLLPRSALLSQGVRQLIVLKRHGLRAPAAVAVVRVLVPVHHVVADLLKVAGDFGLYSTQHLQLGAAPRFDIPKDGQLLILLASGPRALHLYEEHEGPPLLLDGAKEVPGSARDKSHSLLWHPKHGQVPIVVVLIHRHRPSTLRHHTFRILLGPAALHLGAPDLQHQVTLKQLDLCFGNPGDLLLGLATFAQDERCIVVGDLHGVNPIVIRFLRPALSGLAAASAPAVLLAGAAAILALPIAAAASVSHVGASQNVRLATARPFPARA